MIRLACVLSCLAMPAAAQELNFTPALQADCIARAGDVAEAKICIGVATEACIADTPGGASTAGMAGCAGRELELWDALLNTEYARLRAEAAQLDKGTVPASVPPDHVTNSLRDMQRAWIAFRDASCVFAESQWGGGTGGRVAYASCLMRMTAEQALALQGTELIY